MTTDDRLPDPQPITIDDTDRLPDPQPTKEN